jgi:hypothetical protein
MLSKKYGGRAPFLAVRGRAMRGFAALRTAYQPSRAATTIPHACGSCSNKDKFTCFLAALTDAHTPSSECPMELLA